ncbi:hypothetical protein [Aquimarina algiphila]|uniref:Uncharacterized protein n=1 Tax=Aquimarina algiphila TaxID=2047982 RepID=A0A554VE36_9FLAO|nr:hypothetical protein [Aquimarina algiphila]TSE05243.1 hypothetical protein FOF46_23555 [Aquimarina algiphila]
MTVKEFLMLDDMKELEKVKAIRKYVKPSNKIGKKEGKELLKIAYKDVNRVKDLYKQNKIIELIYFLTDCDEDYLMSRDYKEFIYFLRYVDDELSMILKLENKLNKADEGDELLVMRLEQAGANDLNQFGTLNAIDSLANGDLLKWKLIEEMPYEMVYTKLLMNKIQSRVQRKYQEIMIEEHKSNGKN